MGKVLLFLLLSFLSSNSLAKVGDSYMCEMVTHVSNDWRPEKAPVNQELEKFSFKRHEDSITLRPLNGGTMRGNFVISHEYGSESFTAEGINLVMTYHDGWGDDDFSGVGLFNLAVLYIPLGIQSVGAMCKKIQ